jgi:hypothetical protein
MYLGGQCDASPAAGVQHEEQRTFVLEALLEGPVALDPEIARHALPEVVVARNAMDGNAELGEDGIDRFPVAQHGGSVDLRGVKVSVDEVAREHDDVGLRAAHLAHELLVARGRQHPVVRPTTRVAEHGEGEGLGEGGEHQRGSDGHETTRHE